MGHSYLYRCERCGYQEHFNQGHGFLVHSQPLNDYLKLNVKLFHYKTHKALQMLAIKQNNLFVKAGFEIYKCPKCKTLSDKIEVTVYNETRVLQKSEFRCSGCRARLKKTNIHRLKTATCPACHEIAFHIDHAQKNLWG